MTGRAGRCLLASLLCVGLLAVVATGGAAAAGPEGYCESESVGENESVIFGGVGDSAFTGDITLHAGSTLKIGYCSDGEPVDSDWLADGDGFDKEDEREEHTYTVEITGENDSIDFGEHLAEGNQSSLDEQLVVSAVGGGTEGNDTGGGLDVDDDQIEATYRDYRSTVNETENATAALNETTSALEAGDGNLSEANETVYSLQEDYQTMTNTRAALLGELRSAGANGTVTGTVAAAGIVDDEYQRTDSAVEQSATAYTDAVGAETDDDRSEVLLSVFGSLGAGVALGLVAGAAIPLVAARRVKEKMKLSRDVSYDRKTALIPILIGLVAAVAGAVILVGIVELNPLLRVIA